MENWLHPDRDRDLEPKALRADIESAQSGRHFEVSSERLPTDCERYDPLSFVTVESSSPSINPPAFIQSLIHSETWAKFRDFVSPTSQTRINITCALSFIFLLEERDKKG